MAWLLVKMAWLLYFLVQLNKFWTSNTLICAKWQHLKHGHFHPFQGQQFSYIVYDNGIPQNFDLI
jgi:isoprenylcysteine carboxyl methyltransferase (ICMT) family protein YpbQ